MIREVIMHTDAMDIPKGYIYDTETPDFYVYRHKYTGDEIHRSKNPPLYVNIQPYINEALDKIRAEVVALRNIRAEEFDIDSDVFDDRVILRSGVLDIIDKCKAESEVKK